MQRNSIAAEGEHSARDGASVVTQLESTQAEMKPEAAAAAIKNPPTHEEAVVSEQKQHMSPEQTTVVPAQQKPVEPIIASSVATQQEVKSDSASVTTVQPTVAQTQQAVSDLPPSPPPLPADLLTTPKSIDRQAEPFSYTPPEATSVTAHLHDQIINELHQKVAEKQANAAQQAESQQAKDHSATASTRPQPPEKTWSKDDIHKAVEEYKANTSQREIEQRRSSSDISADAPIRDSHSVEKNTANSLSIPEMAAEVARKRGEGNMRQALQAVESETHDSFPADLQEKYDSLSHDLKNAVDLIANSMTMPEAKALAGYDAQEKKKSSFASR